MVGVLDDELADRPEVTFDAVEEAGVGRRRDELDVVGCAQARMSLVQCVERLSITK